MFSARLSRKRLQTEDESINTDMGLPNLKQTTRAFTTGFENATEMPQKPAPMEITVPDLLEPGTPPCYTIDLSMPPKLRYHALAMAYKEKIMTLPTLLDDILESFSYEYWFLRPSVMKRLARLLLRRVHDPEQMEELEGIREATGLDMYLLVAFNVLLDLFVGCTSGGVRITERSNNSRKPHDNVKMMHFRTLDWEMDPLRNVVVHLEFVANAGGPVIATNVTYLGFVGVLTGVRPGLSASFNFRLNARSIQTLSFPSRILYYMEKLLVVLGKRPSIPSILRKYIVPETQRIDARSYQIKESSWPSLDRVAKAFVALKTAQCFVILCDGRKTVVIEKDWRTAHQRSDHSFIVCTNHDQAEEQTKQDNDATTLLHGDDSSLSRDKVMETAALVGMEEILEESVDRKRWVEQKWTRAIRRYRNDTRDDERDDCAVTMRQLRGWVTTEPVCARCTHYAVIMDPVIGRVVWSRRFPEPVDEYDDELETLES